MALPVPAALLVGLSLALAAVSARAQTAPASPVVASDSAAEAAARDETSLSPECRSPGSKLFTIAKLKAVKTALREHRAIHVLTLGPGPAPGLGLATPYPVRLETELTKSFPNVEVDVDSRTLSGEIAAGATERLRAMIAEIEPDLLVWQAGGNDALARVDLDGFRQSLIETVEWVKSHNIDLVLVDPQYTASLSQDDYYARFVATIREVAAQTQVPLVQRYEAMRVLAAKQKGRSLQDQFRLSDQSWRCMAEHVTRAITVSLLEPDAAVTNSLPPVTPAKPVAGAPSR